MSVNKNNYCIIMAGGIGARFWPMSTSKKPKQFIDILGTGTSLIQQTFNRFLSVCPKENILIVTNRIYKDLVMEQLKGIGEQQILCEPCRRNTAPAIAYACHKIASQNMEANIVVAPSDHIILNEAEFSRIISNAFKATASNDFLITLGIKPSRPDTGYGYIQFEESANDLKKVSNFTEKPNLERAKEFLASGDFLWNAGIFVWSLKSILKALESHLPAVNRIFKAGFDKYNTPAEQNFVNDAFISCENISLDYGILEKSDNVFVIPSEFGWSDLGTWGSLYSIREKDDDSNTVVGNNVLTYDSKNCIVNMPEDKLVVIQGLDDYIVVEDEGVLLICKKTDEQRIRQFADDVDKLKG